MAYASTLNVRLLTRLSLRGFNMSSAIGKQKLVQKRSQRKSPGVQSPKQTAKKDRKSKVFPWKLLFGVVAIISVMTLLSNPIDPNLIRDGSSKNNQSGLNSISLGK
mgnify:CR=1 FL=1